MSERIKSLSDHLRAIIAPAIQGQPPEVAMPALLTVVIQLTMTSMEMDQVAATQLIIDELNDAKRGAMS